MTISDDQLIPGRREALYKLLRLGPEPLTTLVRCTGWPEEQTRLALEQLLASNRVCKIRRHGSVPLFQVRTE